jgi:hypothetical protein
MELNPTPKGIKALVGKKMTKDTKFLGSTITISKLSVSEVTLIQEQAKAAEAAQDDMAGLELLKTVIRSAVDGGADLTDEDFDGFPMDELSRISQEIMKFSGIGAEAVK